MCPKAYEKVLRKQRYESQNCGSADNPSAKRKHVKRSWDFQKEATACLHMLSHKRIGSPMASLL